MIIFLFPKARIWDVRRLEDGSSLAHLPHGRVVNSAYFSPLSGSKILTTSQDNRIRVWDSIFGNLESPSREIVHSHDFNRHLTPFKAEWDPKVALSVFSQTHPHSSTSTVGVSARELCIFPTLSHITRCSDIQDPSESLAVIGRYISENYGGVALHPIDFIDTTTGQLVAEAVQPDITTISPVNKPHPREDILASGSSRSNTFLLGFSGFIQLAAEYFSFAADLPYSVFLFVWFCSLLSYFLRYFLQISLHLEAQGDCGFR